MKLCSSPRSAAFVLAACLAPAFAGLTGCDDDASRGATRTTSAAVPAADNADNTRINRRDRPSDLNAAANGPNAPTPFDQSNDPADLAVTQRIRQAVVANPSLSVDAKNIKIITAKGVVTLRGPVEDDAERATVAAKATELAGDNRVDDLLDVKRAP